MTLFLSYLWSVIKIYSSKEKCFTCIACFDKFFPACTFKVPMSNKGIKLRWILKDHYICSKKLFFAWLCFSKIYPYFLCPYLFPTPNLLLNLLQQGKCFTCVACFDKFFLACTFKVPMSNKRIKLRWIFVTMIYVMPGFVGLRFTQTFYLLISV